MPQVSTIVLFISSSLLLAIAPGPDNLFVLAQSAHYGARSGLTITAGLCSGLVVHTLLVAFGVAALITASPLAFTVLQGCGAAYLLYLAYTTFAVNGTQNAEAPSLSCRELYIRGVIMNLTNPKVLLFFMSLLPQFADTSRGALPPQIIFFGILFIISAALVFSTISLTAGSAGLLLRSKTGSKILNLGAGTVFLFLGLMMIVDIGNRYL